MMYLTRDNDRCGAYALWSECPEMVDGCWVPMVEGNYECGNMQWSAVNYPLDIVVGCGCVVEVRVVQVADAREN
jgi:hypothetical protein